MTAATPQARFMANNFIGDDILIRATSAASGFPAANVYDPLRSRVWKAAGYFAITASNGTFYFNDGSARTATVPAGAYTQATLATAIAAAAVASGATATVVASAYSTAPYIWQLVFNTSVTLTLSSTSNAIWDVLGFTGSTNRTGTTFRADAARAHTYEQLTFNFGSPRAVTFAGLIGPISEALSLSASAVVTLMASNVDSWDSPAASWTLPRADAGVFSFVDSDAPEYEYYALRIVDRENVLGSAGIKIGHLYLGDHTTLTTSNVGIGWTKQVVDPSTVQRSVGGQRYVNRRSKYRVFRGMTMGLIEASERRTIEQTLHDVGVGVPFYLSIDPTLAVSAELPELTFCGALSSDPNVKHVIRDRYSIDFDVEECA